MKKKTNKDQQENYLERKPKRHEAIAWAKDEKGIVTLDIENTGFFNRLAQKFFHKPKVTHIHLDEMGSFVWPIMDGEKDIIAIGKEVEEQIRRSRTEKHLQRLLLQDTRLHMYHS